MIKSLCRDPFRLLFPIAITLAFYGSLSWIFYSFFQIGEYPTELHARLFIGGYLYLTIIGFLMTAIPRFTQTSFAKPYDLFQSLTYSLLIWLAILLNTEYLFWSAITIGWIHLLIFAISRFRARKQNPPFTFLFVGLGVLMGLIGSSSLLLSYIIGPSSFIDLERLGKLFFYDGMVLSLILGIGGRLIPGILGFKEIVSKQRKIYESPKSFMSIIPKSIFILGALYLLSFLLELYHHSLISYIIRASVVSYIAILYWNIHKSPKEKKTNNLFLRLSCITLVIASWMLVFFPNYTIDIKHLIYIGGYSLMTFLVAARVVLAHGNNGLELEKRHYPFTIFGSLLILAALTRATAILIPTSYLNHLGYTALLYFISLVIWGIVFLPRVLKMT